MSDLAHRPKVLLVENDYVPGVCWQLLGRVRGRDISPEAYGQLRLRDGSMVKAHRWAFEQVNGAIPEGIHIHHLCFNKLCMRPGHLAAITRRENSRLNNFPQRLVEVAA